MINFNIYCRCKDVIYGGKEGEIDANIDGGKWYHIKYDTVKKDISSLKNKNPVLPPILGWKPFPANPIPPNFNYGNIYHYLLESVVLLNEHGKKEDTGLSHMTSKPLTKGEQYVKSGSVTNVMDNVKSGPYYFVKAKVDASMKNEQRTAHVTLSNVSGAVLDASCTCPGSALGRCNHVAALLLYINKHVKENGYDPLSCTAKTCEWNQGKKTGKNPSKISEATYSLYKPKAAKLSDFDPRPKNMRSVGYAVKKEFVTDLKYNSLTVGKPSMWESLLKSIITYDNYDLDAERKALLKDLAWSFFTNIRSDGAHFSSNTYMIPGTEPQAESQQWKSSRWFRITASTAKQAHNLGSLLIKPIAHLDSTYRKLFNYLSYHVWDLHPFSTIDTMYGIENEDRARTDYMNSMLTCSPGIKVIKTGLWINKLWPELGCSPDGLVYDPHGTDMYGLVEIKCPKLLKTIAPADVFKSLERKVINNKDLYSACFSRPTAEDTHLELKTTHAYYYQIQLQLAITGLKWCDFVLWSPIGKPNIERIHRDDQLIVTMIGNITTLWQKVIGPEIFEMRVPRKLFPIILD